MYYLAYGSNLNIIEMKQRSPFSKIIGSTYLYGYKLCFKGTNIGFLLIEPNERSTVPIGIYKINKFDLKSLDKYESYPNFYYKKKIEFEYNGIITKGFIYIMNENFNYALPDSSYLRRCEIGYNDFNFDKSYLYDAINCTKNDINKQKFTRNMHL